MQNGRADRIERSVEIRSSNRVCPRAGLLVVLAVPTRLNAYTKLICTPPPRFTYVKYISQSNLSRPCPFVYLPAYAVSVGTSLLTLRVIPITYRGRLSGLQATLEIPASSILLQCQGSAYISTYSQERISIFFGSCKRKVQSAAISRKSPPIYTNHREFIN